jgi:restriction endonuclease Mrr
LDRLAPPQFEALIGDLLRAYGFKQVRRALGADGGFDFSAQVVKKDPFGRAEIVEWLVEVKSTRRQTDISSLRAFLGALSLRKEHGLFVTAGQVTSPAKNWLEQVSRSGAPRVSLIEGPEVKRLVLAKPGLVAKYFGGQREP